MIENEKRVIEVDGEVLRREYEEKRKRIEAQPHHQKCSWCDAKPIRAVAPMSAMTVAGDYCSIPPGSWVSACADHLDKLQEVDDRLVDPKGKLWDVIAENDPVARAGFDAMSKMVADHISGDGIARRATVNFDVKCSVCGRANLVLIGPHIQDANWDLGCAYSIGGGLCLNHVEISPDEADLLIETQSVLAVAEIMHRRMR